MTDQSRTRPLMKRLIKAKLAKILILMSILFLLAGNLQNSMLYYPDSSLPAAEDLASRSIRFWPSGPDGYRGFVSAARSSEFRGTVIVFHGNAGTAADRVYYAEALTPLGYRVLLAEYPGYGKRPGDLGEKPFVEDALESVRLAGQQYGKPLFLLGESLGSGVAAAVAQNTSVSIQGLILVTPWDTLLDVARDKFPWLPVRLFLTDTYDTVGNLKQFREKVAILGAGRDQVIPVKHARKLYESIHAPRRIWIIEQAGHNDWPDRADPRIWNEIMEYLHPPVE